MEEKILYSWVGYADLRSYFKSTDDANLCERIQSIVGTKSDIDKMEMPGPIETAVMQGEYDRIYLLWNHKDRDLRYAYEKFIGRKCRIIDVPLNNPIDYEDIYLKVDTVMRETSNNQDGHRYILLSPGTPAMAAVWLLLGKTKYPADFIQVYKGNCISTKIPFDIRMDVLPGLISVNDAKLEGVIDDMLEDISGFNAIVGKSPALLNAINRGKRAALHDVNVLITGESGTGKEMFARAIHQASRRSKKPFIAVNCGAISPNLLEAELFGYKKNAFTGAKEDKAGFFKAANGGTLFLDEIGECSRDLQSKLLRVLQAPSDKPFTYRPFIPVGGNDEEHSNVRIIAATNKKPLDEVAAGNFREDLYYRLATFGIELPPLRERTGDIPLLAQALLDCVNARFMGGGYVEKHFSVKAMQALENCAWVGNVRQLYGVIIGGAVMALGDTIDVRDLDLPGDKVHNVKVAQTSLNLDEAINALKRKYIRQALEQSQGSKTKACRLLGMKSYQRLDAMIKSLEKKT